MPMLNTTYPHDQNSNLQMMSTINFNLESIRKELASFKRTSDENRDDIEGLKFVQHQDREAIMNMHEQLLQNTRQIKTLSSLVIKLEDQLRIQKDKENAINAKAWKSTMKVKGYDPEKHPDVQDVIKDFLEVKLSLSGGTKG